MANVFLAILGDERSKQLAASVSTQLGFVEPVIVIGTPNDAVGVLKGGKMIPLYILIDIAARGIDIINELEQLAEYCDVRTRVVIIGETNDLHFYRQLIQKGVSEYFVKPADLGQIKSAFLAGSQTAAANTQGDASGKVVSFFSAASGDGATTIAVNVAYTLANQMNLPTVIVDMDYQFGLVARNLDLSPNTGLRELYDHPEGSIDLTLVEKTIEKYRDKLFVIGAPKKLLRMPEISGNTIANIIYTLRKKFKFVILDLPHQWNDWISIVMKEVDHNFLAAQLNIKSVTHTSRILDTFAENGVQSDKTSIVINRSGSKLKEPITAADFSMACKKKPAFYVSNDSKTIAQSEDQGRTAVEIGNNVLNKQFTEIATFLTKL